MSQLSHDILQAFAPILTQRTMAKNERLHEAGRVGNRLYLVESGLLRAYYLLDGRDVTAHFATAGESVTAPDSFLRCQPSRYYIEALADSQAYVIERQDLEDYLDRHPEYERLARLYTEDLYMDLLRRSESMTFLSAQERYANLLNDRPEILEFAPLGHVASYLGMSQETLSRVRAER
ncbi:Crp/Fnr family transcriptional regulator [Lewinella sp. IMCC34191]|uniref:Crp/Fnr family transcriptional regulator n=1 Tax=Lewinella sp. IMCC34191 TaxID=2259172 RepID=UPI000E282DB6|nr:Crp/Fnr family transcriptional regulator [Lewinella sp. IMCC34191]